MSDRKIATELDTSRPTVADWRKRYISEGINGLYNDRPRGKSFEAISQKKEAEIVEKTLHEKPVGATNRSCRSLSIATGISKNSVQRIWNAHSLKPHLTKSFKLSNDPNFIEKLTDVVGLYMNPPENALVFYGIYRSE